MYFPPPATDSDLADQTGLYDRYQLRFGTSFCDDRLCQPRAITRRSASSVAPMPNGSAPQQMHVSPFSTYKFFKFKPSDQYTVIQLLQRWAVGRTGALSTVGATFTTFFLIVFVFPRKDNRQRGMTVYIRPDAPLSKSQMTLLNRWCQMLPGGVRRHYRPLPSGARTPLLTGGIKHELRNQHRCRRSLRADSQQSVRPCIAPLPYDRATASTVIPAPPAISRASWRRHLASLPEIKHHARHRGYRQTQVTTLPVRTAPPPNFNPALHRR